MPELDENRQMVMSIETNIIMTIIKKNQDYLGTVRFVMVRQEMGDVFLFPVRGRPKRTFCVIVKRPYSLDKITRNVENLLASG